MLTTVRGGVYRPRRDIEPNLAELMCVCVRVPAVKSAGDNYSKIILARAVSMATNYIARLFDRNRYTRYRADVSFF